VAMKPEQISLSLIDQDEQRFGLEQLAGRHSLVYFGFLHCRVVCPASLAKLSAVIAGVEEPDRFRVLYISVDPDRDTPAAMKAFLAEHYPGFIGLTGSNDAIQAAKTSLSVFTRRVADPADPDGYAVPHTAMIYLVDEHGQYQRHFAAHLEAQTIIEELRKVVPPLPANAKSA
jgi:protein SCO1/2